MKVKLQDAAWRAYERYIASLYSSAASDAITVIPNARLVGAISGISRQIDCLIDARVKEYLRRRITDERQQEQVKSGRQRFAARHVGDKITEPGTTGLLSLGINVFSLLHARK